ncbi:hypothetical protein LTR09_011663 [Extremus antarcticus]|uniref:F-box domain-containing protein n=1 Tax=Extremus antarcticus TaxID=702011 RepID=A0AAJ0DBL9_9PEZI|nr:hypothetical protein LTR09_011663 [Extremus antarcticus]
MAHADSSNQMATGQGVFRLLDLPAEITERAAELCDPYDLLAFRRVSHEVASRIMRTYLATHFTYPGVLLSHGPSLQKLANICRHKHFGKTLKTVTFSTLEIPEMDDRLRTHSLANQPPTDWTGLDLEEQCKLVSQEWTHKSFLETQRDYQSTSEGVDLLTTIFSRLKLLKHAVEIRISHTTSPNPYATCEKALEDATGEQLLDTPHSARPMSSIVQAVDRSGYSVHKLNMEYHYLAAFLADPADLMMLVFAERLFVSLGALVLDDIYNEIHMSIPQMCRMSWMSGAAQSLESLDLSTFCGVANEDLQNMPWPITHFLTTFTFPAVSWIRLHGFLLELKAIIQFIAQNKTFKTVIIRKSRFLTEELDMYAVPKALSEHDEALSKILKEETGLVTINVEDCRLQIREAVDR